MSAVYTRWVHPYRLQLFGINTQLSLFFNQMVNELFSLLPILLNWVYSSVFFVNVDDDDIALKRKCKHFRQQDEDFDENEVIFMTSDDDDENGRMVSTFNDDEGENKLGSPPLTTTMLSVHGFYL